MYKIVFSAAVFFTVNLNAQPLVQLSEPQTASQSVYFNKSACIIFDFRQPGAVIRYTTNGDEPDENSPVLKDSVCVSKSSVIKAKSFAVGFISSPAVTVRCIKTKKAIKTIEGSMPASSYNKGGLKTIYDGKGGSTGFNNRWLGFNVDTIQWNVFLNKKQQLKKINIGLLRAQGSWIFYPVKIELLSLDGKLLASPLLINAEEETYDDKNIFSLPVKIKTNVFQLKIYNLGSLPAWHPGKGNKPWLFTDEISVE